MEIDDESTESSISTPPLLGSPLPLRSPPLLRSSPLVEKGRRICIICFAGASVKNAKRAKLEKIKDIKSYEERALEWTNYEHEYNKIYKTVDWRKSGEFHAHTKCKGIFNKVSFMTSQTKKIVTVTEVEQEKDDHDPNLTIDIPNVIEEPRRSSRVKFSYQSNQEDLQCIICVGIKKDNKGEVIPVKSMTFSKEDITHDKEHLVEKILKEFAEIHVKKETKFKEAGERILLNAKIKSLFASNSGYHMQCYRSFRASSWKRIKTGSRDQEISSKDHVTEFISIVEYLVILKREIYTLKHLRELYADIKQVDIDSVRSIDIKQILEGNLSGKIQFCTPTDKSCSHGLSSEYILSADTNILPDAISAIITGEGITNYMQLKAIARSISTDIQNRKKVPWPPTPQDILQSNDLDLNKQLFNMIAWITSPNANLDKNGFVTLSYRKATKVCEIVQNIQSLVPNAQPGFNQVLLSITMLAKTGSKMVVNDLKQLGHGLSTYETMFIQDKWAEWTENESSIIPSNMKKGVIATHVFDNIDWKNKSLSRVETHHTNSILVQKYDILENMSNVTLDSDYNFERKKHRSYKGSSQVLPNFYFKRGPIKSLKYIDVNDREECTKSTLYSLVWVHSRITKDLQKVPSWSGFKELVTNRDLDVLTVGYLPPIPYSPTEYKVILEEIRRTQQIMIELETDFIFIEADQAIYTKVLNVMFSLKNKGEDLFKTIIPRMGGFHIGMCMLRTIYALFKRCGVVQLLSSSGLGGLGTVKKALTGGDVKEGINLHKKLYEAILRTKIENTEITNCNDAMVFDDDSDIEKNLLKELKENVNRKTFNDVVQSGTIKPLPGASPGSMGWLMDVYIEMVDMLLNYIHFLRTGNWEGYLEVLFQFLPYCFRFNRHNYARNLSYYYVHMRALKEENSAAFEYLKNGGFSGSLTGRTHSRIPFDQVIEMTINRSCKDVGGLSRSTENPGATERWTRIHHHIVALRDYLNKKTHKRIDQKHVELGAGRIIRDEVDVSNIKTSIEAWLPEIWKDDKPMINFATGEIATVEMEKDTIDLRKKGEELRDEFIGRITEDDPKLSYYDPIKKQEIKLFEKKKQKKNPSIPEDEGQSFCEILATFDQKKLNLRKIVEYCVTSRPWMIVNENEESRASQKHLLRNNLQNMCPIPKSSHKPENISTSIVDAMRVVNMISIAGLKPRIFRSWADAIMEHLKSYSGNNLHVLFDNYDYEHNIPSKQRSVSQVERVISSLEQELPPTKEWGEFLMNRTNKLQVVNLLANYIMTGSIANKKVVVNKGSDCYMIDHGANCVRAPEFDSSHREADQKIPMHAVYVGQNSNEAVCVVAEDTDIYLSLITISHLVSSPLYFRQGKSKDKDGILYHNVHAIADHLGEDICKILLAFHSLTGSDFTFPFFGRSKTNAFKKMIRTPESHRLLSSIQSGQPNIKDVTNFVLHIIYNRPLKEKTPGEARYNMMMQKKKQQKEGKKKKKTTTKDLPPDQSSLKMKILRASFYAHCMSSCLDPNYIPLDASLYAWRYIDEEKKWEPVWYEGNPLPSPDEVLDNSDNEEDVDDDENCEDSLEVYNDNDDEDLSDDSTDYATSDDDNRSDDSDDFEF